MGAVFCCFRVPDEPNNTSSDDSCPLNCLCPKCFFRKLSNKSRAIFTRRQMPAISSSSPQPSSSDSVVVFSSLSDATVSESNEAPQRPEKGPGSSRVRPEPIREHDTRVNPKSIQGENIVVSEQKIRSQEQNSASFAKILSMGVEWGNSTIPSADEEDVCPTCLEEYNKDHPKIIPECSHHFHLSCILAWMERSADCPVCGKLMLFKEAN